MLKINRLISYILLIILYVNVQASTPVWIDSLGLTSTQKQNKGEVLNAFMLECNNNIGFDTEKLEQMANAMFEYAEKWDSTDRKAQALNFIGIALQFQGVMDSAISMHTNALEMYRATENRSMIGHTLKVIGNAYYQQGLYENCIENYLKAKQIAIELGDKGTEISLTHNLSVIYKSSGNYIKSMQMIREVLSFAYTNNDSVRLCNSYNTLANLHYALDPSNFDSTYHYYVKAESYINSQTPPGVISLIYTNLSTVCFNITEPGKRKKYLDLAHTYAQKAYPYLDQSAADQRFHIYRTLGQSTLELGNSKGLVFLDSAYLYAKRLGDFYSIKDACEPLFKYYYSVGDKEKGWSYYIEFSRMVDSIHHYDRIQAVEDAETKYNTQALKLSNLQLSLDSQKKAQKNKQLMLILLCFALVVFSLFFLYWIRVRNKELRWRKKEMELKDKLIKSNIEGVEQERLRVARELHDGVGQQLSSISLGLEHLDLSTSGTEQTLKEVKALTSETLESVRDLSHQMMPLALRRFGLVHALESLIEFQNKHSQCAFEFEYLNNTELGLPQSSEVHLYRIVQEVVHNMSKHSDASEVTIQLYMQDGVLKLMVSDNGKAYTLEGAGMGYNNLKNRVELINGSMELSRSNQENLLMIMVKIY